MWKYVCFAGTCLKNNNIAKKQSFKTKILNKPPYYLQAYHLYLRNVIMYKRNKVSKIRIQLIGLTNGTAQLFVVRKICTIFIKLCSIIIKYK